MIKIIVDNISVDSCKKLFIIVFPLRMVFFFTLPHTGDAFQERLLK